MGLFRRIFFNLSYFRKPRWDTGISPPELTEFIATRPAGRALDLGCGTGTNAITLAKHGWQATGVDFALPAIRKAQQKARKAGLEVNFRLGDVTRLEDIAGPFDLILDIGCFHSLSSLQKQDYIRNLDQFLAPGGTFLLYAFLRPLGAEQRGITLQEIDDLQKCLRLVSRKGGSDHGGLASTWLAFEKP